MKSILNISVSCFKDYGTPDNPQNVNLLSWLRSGKYADVVKQIRQVEDKKERDKLKSTLPAITPSGTFTYRAADKLIKHSGLIQFDIDFQDNQHIANYDKLKTQLCNIENVAYCGLSVSGRGYWGLMPIKHKDKHKSHFRALKKQFQHIGLTIDDKPSNVAALRGYSYDPAGYFNHSAAPFELLDKLPEIQHKRTHFNNDTQSEVETLIEKIQAQRIDITAGYDEWLKLAFAFSEEFGESGRDYFHAVSQYHCDYNQRETDKQFTHCLKARGSGVTISSFFYLCQQYGIVLKTDTHNHSDQRDRALQAKFESQKSDNSEKNGYLAQWDDISVPKPGSQEDIEAIRHVANDADAEELQQLMNADPILKEIVQTFDCELITNN